MTDSNDRDRIESLAGELRSAGGIDQQAVKQRVMTAIRETHRRPASRTRNVTLVALAGVAAVVMFAVLGTISGNGEVEEGVLFQLEAPDAATVFMAGDFNDWDPRATPLNRQDDGASWSVRLPLASGTYRYSFVIDGQWVSDPRAGGRGVADDFGGSNSLITVSSR